MRLTSLILLLVIVMPAISTPRTALAAPWQDKVDPWVLATAATGETEFIIFLAEQADLSQARQLTTKFEKGAYVYERLTEVARRSQGPVVAELASGAVEYRPYWIANMIWARGDLRMVSRMAQRADVAHIYANPWVRLEGPVGEVAGVPPQAVNKIEWNISKVRAPQVWAAGYSGQGAVVGGQDTGYEWDHPALKDHYRGWDGFTADHNFNWHDAIHESTDNPCGSDANQPCDDHGHGTHTMGTMLGDDPSHSHQIGMAPGARWIGCRNMDLGFGSPITYSECYQWFLAPTDLNDQNPDPSKAPDVINNSWGCPVYEGCTDPNVLLSVVEAVRAAGILTVHSAGNSGPNCSTVDTPAAIYDASFTVGATTQADSVASFSSRGLVTVDGSRRLKPDISAPGRGIYSSFLGGSYIWMSGTSMAGPHVAGLVALIISAHPALRGQVDAIEQLIEQTALPIESSWACGGIPGSQTPNPISGWGRIDAWLAQWVLLSPEVNRSTLPGWTATYDYTLTNTHAASDVFDLIVNSSQGWASTSPSEVTLEPGMSAIVTVSVVVPGDAVAGSSDLTTLTATSRANPTVSASVTNTTTVGEPYFLPLYIR